MPSSQNDIGLFSNQLTERYQERVDISGGGVTTLTPPTSIGNTPCVIVVQADGGAYRYTNNDSQDPGPAFGIKIDDTGLLTFLPADINNLKFHRDGTDATFLNVGWYTFARATEL